LSDIYFFIGNLGVPSTFFLC